MFKNGHDIIVYKQKLWYLSENLPPQISARFILVMLLTRNWSVLDSFSLESNANSEYKTNRLCISRNLVGLTAWIWRFLGMSQDLIHQNRTSSLQWDFLEKVWEISPFPQNDHSALQWSQIHFSILWLERPSMFLAHLFKNAQVSVQERHNFIADTMELSLSCTSPSNFHTHF